MAKKDYQEFNPWPAFVDLFASVIMAILMFMLILIVNVAFYAQFKQKISYTGVVPVGQMIIDEKTQEQEMTNYKFFEKVIESDIKKEIAAKDSNESKTKENDKEIIAGGVDLKKTDQNTTRQESIVYADWMTIKYKNSEIVLDAPTIKEIETFIESSKKAFPNHSIAVFTSEPKNQTSSTVSRQIGLSRALNVRNLIRKLDYERDMVKVRLKETIPQDKKSEHPSGYVVIMVNRGA